MKGDTLLQIYHPSQSVRGLPPENTFLAADASGAALGEGFLIPTYHPHLFPERPLNIYLSLKAPGPGRDMLMGALLARAQQLREASPRLPARLFAQVAPQDAQLLSYYIENGFDQSDALDVVRITPPDARPSAPMGFDLGFLPLNGPGEINAFMSRMNMYRLNAWSPKLLQTYMSFPHFFGMYLARGGNIVGEAAFTGSGAAAKLIGLYVAPEHRRKGMAKILIAAGMKTLAEKGVTAVDADVIRRSTLQCALAASCGATFVRTACFYPGLNYD